MRRTIINFAVNALIIGIVFCVTANYVFWKWFPSVHFNGIYFLAFVLFAVTVGFHTFLVKATESRPQSFINRFIALTGIKLLFYLFFILLYAFLFKQNAVPFLFSFLCGYFTYTVFEVISIMIFLQKNNEK
jgi:hypothetical protein